MSATATFGATTTLLLLARRFGVTAATFAAFGTAAAAFRTATTTTAAATPAASAFLVGMAVGEFGEFCRADGGDLNIEVQRLTSQRVIAVEDHFLAVDLLNQKFAHPEVGLGMKTHSHGHGVRAEAF